MTRLPAVPGLAEYAFGLKTMADAIALRDHVVRQLDLADATDDPVERRARATFVGVGASYTSIEAVTQLGGGRQTRSGRQPPRAAVGAGSAASRGNASGARGRGGCTRSATPPPYRT